jgi:hypothetical protein
MQVIYYFASLVDTIVVEICVALLFGYRSESAWQTVILMNLMTHPLLGYILWINSYVSFADTTLLIVVLEIMIVFVEWGILFFILREKPRRLLCLSLAANASSLGIGIILFGLL